MHLSSLLPRLWLAAWLGSLAVSAIAMPVSAQEMTESRRIAVARRLQQSTVSVVAGPSTGSGFVVGRERFIITNAHVVEAARDESGRVQVRFGSGTILPARVVRVDPSHDLAILEVEGRVPSRPLDLGNSDAVEVGQTVLAFGSPFGLDGTLTEGIVSARRDVPGIGGGMARRLIQTDAPINPGNSGGPLVDGRGRVIGVNTAILSRTGGSHGIGFAVPSNYINDVIRGVREQRRTGRSVEANQRSAQTVAITNEPPDPLFGVHGTTWDAEGVHGVQILQTEPGSPAHRAGLLGANEPPPPLVARRGLRWTGHIITALDGEPVNDADEFNQRISAHHPGDRVTVTVTVGPGAISGDTTVILGATPSHR